MSSRKLILITFSTLVFLNIARLIGWTFLAQTAIWNRIVYDVYHHYQLGILLLAFTLIFLKSKKRLRGWIIAIGSGLVIDESMYLFYPLNPNFTHYTVVGIGFEFLLLAIFSCFIIKLRRERN